ncbi:MULTISPECIES: hypothetical protein [unclassified Caballeronia]|uniref:hypothetical protein n=1 Tax=unclassified Caballeronia TaxID=2646786 RepID=UPI002027D562|nr:MULTISPECIES: hypothetical protein [unclassified Caballeronia]
MAFRIDPSSIVSVETRRGINATATIVSDEGVEIGEVDDITVRIVADVAFVSAGARSAFIKEARRANPSSLVAPTTTAIFALRSMRECFLLKRPVQRVTGPEPS